MYCASRGLATSQGKPACKNVQKLHFATILFAITLISLFNTAKVNKASGTDVVMPNCNGFIWLKVETGVRFEPLLRYVLYSQCCLNSRPAWTLLWIVFYFCRKCSIWRGLQVPTFMKKLVMAMLILDTLFMIQAVLSHQLYSIFADFLFKTDTQWKLQYFNKKLSWSDKTIFSSYKTKKYHTG